MSDISGNSQKKGNVKDDRNLKRNQYRIICMNVNIGSKKKDSNPTAVDLKQGKENGEANVSTSTDDGREQGIENGEANDSTSTDDGREQGIENGEANGSTPTIRDSRKKVIKQVVDEEKPHIVLFQEFVWNRRSFKGKVWEDFRLDEKYELYGSNSVKIMYDKNEFKVQTIDAVEFPDDISERMSICKMKPRLLGNVEFICVTWHGKNIIKYAEKETTLTNLLTRLKDVCRKYNCPLLLGGDFNLKFEKIEPIVNSTFSNSQTLSQNFKIHPYEPTERRNNKVIDLFITMDIDLESVQPLDIQSINQCVDKITKKQRPVLDHDPISGVLCVRPNNSLYDVTMMVTENQTQIMTELTKLVEGMKDLKSTLLTFDERLENLENNDR